MSSPELIWVYDLTGTQVAVLQAADTISLEEVLQESETLSFNLRADDPKTAYIIEDYQLRYKDRFYRISKPQKIRDEKGPALAVEAEALWMQLLESMQLGVFDIIAETISGGLTQILDGTDWTVGDVETDGGTFSLEESDATVLKLVRDWAIITQREVEFDTANKQISFVIAQGSDNGIAFRYAYNLRSITRTAIAPQATRLYPYGNNNLSIDGVSLDGKSYVDDFSFYTGQGLTLAEAQARFTKVQVWVDDTYVSALTLYDNAIAKLALLAQPQVSYEMTVADLSSVTGWPEDSWALGDVVKVVDSILDLDLTARVVRLIKKPYEPENNTIELSTLQNIGTTVTVSSRPGLTGGSGFDLLVDENAAIATISTTQQVINSLNLSFAGQGNTVIGVEVDGTASAADGELTLTFWWGTTQVGPPAGSKVAYLASKAVQVGIPISVVGLEGSNNFYVKAQITSGSGTISVPVGQARLYIMATGALGGGVSTDNNVQIVDAFTYVFQTTTDTVVISQSAQTPISLSESNSDTIFQTITDVVAATNFPVQASSSVTVTESVRATLVDVAAVSDSITTSESIAATLI